MVKQETEQLLKVGISQGDPSGIGLEVIIKTFSDPRMLQICTPIIYGSSKAVSFHKKTLGLNDLQISTIKNPENADVKHINLINVSDEEVKIEWGTSTQQAGKLAFKSLEAAVKDVAENKIQILVTAPINKQNIQSVDFNFPGHTEYLADQFKVKENLMLMIAGELRVAVLTGHIPIQKVAEQISTEKIISKFKIFNRSLIEDFGIRKPKIAILGLNPHAGDNGLLGKEENTVIQPAIEKLKAEGMLAFGPYPADGFFGSSTYQQFDGVLAMYHDQGLVPFKALSFSQGVNYTAGLPIIRTSPDHGTGYDIAGKNIASESSFRQAVYLAVDAYKKRQEYKNISSNPLKGTVFKKERG